MRGRGQAALVTVAGWCVEQVEDLAGQVALQAADDLQFGVALGGLLGHVGLGSLVDADAADHGDRCSAELACRSPPRFSR